MKTLDCQTTVKKTLIILLVLMLCSCLIVICYVHALPPAPLISIRTRSGQVTTVISLHAESLALQTAYNRHSETTETEQISDDFPRKPNQKWVTTENNNNKQYQNSTSLLQNNLNLCAQPNPEDGGPIQPNKSIVNASTVEKELKGLLRPGGAFEPKDCKAKYHVAIVIPFRDRYAHLFIFLRNIHPFLMKQKISYRIFVIEQASGQAFNRAALLNAGFLEALKFFNWDCFIFHDVDLLPLDDRNYYNCPRQPRHMSVALAKFNFRLPYSNIFGGVSAMTRKQFETVNGFSNLYFGWGGEDDDMSYRLRQSGYFISRYPVNIARYTMLHHSPEKANPKRFEKLSNTIHTFKTDGLNSIRYHVESVKSYPTFTKCLIDLEIDEQKS